MTSGQDVIETIVTLIEDNITDINSDRAAKNKKWIYDDLPRADISGYPRVSVISPTANSEPHALNSTDQRFKPRVEIQIRIKKGNKYTIGGTEYRDIQALNYLSEQITNLLKNTTSRATMLSNDSVFCSDK